MSIALAQHATVYAPADLIARPRGRPASGRGKYVSR